jgi:hypothetical protein
MTDTTLSESKITQLGRNPYSLGIVARYLGRIEPFSKFEFGPSVAALIHQINDGTHLIVEKDDVLTGYLGWIRTSTQMAEGWMDNTGSLNKVAGGDAIVVTIFHADDSSQILRMIRAAKQMEPDVPVYWKRFFDGTRSPAPRSVKLKRDQT